MSGNTALLAERLAAVRARIAAAEQAAGRPAGSVALLAVSKTQPAEALRTAFAAGQRAFGENYVQEALAKQEALRELPIEWHFIGPVQGNKTKSIAENFDWVHSIDRLKIAQRLSDQRPASAVPLSVCLQVNVSGEASKAGVAPEAAAELARQIAALPRLRLRGLMAIPAPAENPEQQRQPLHQLQELYATLKASGLALDTLSMGMSDDLEAAVAEGSTLVRIGTAIFGARAKTH
jgi:pyridoxal phosphate enzyme (YggS family)